MQAINRALDAGWPVRAALVPDGAERSRWAEACLARVDDVVEVRPDLFARLTDREEPPELILVGRIPAPDLARRAASAPTASSWWSTDPPARATSARSSARADALGAAAVLTTGHGAHLYDPQTVRASVGSLFALPVVPVASNQALIGLARRVASRGAGHRLRHGRGAATWSCARASRSVGPPSLLLGTERTGLARALRDLADVTLAIPMAARPAR